MAGVEAATGRAEGRDGAREKEEARPRRARRRKGRSKRRFICR